MIPASLGARIALSNIERLNERLANGAAQAASPPERGASGPAGDTSPSGDNPERAALVIADLAGNAAALSIWDRDEHEDRGSCGGVMLKLRGGSKIAKEALAMGIAYRSGTATYLSLKLPEEIRSQNRDIVEAQYEAFRRSLQAQGFASAVVEHYSYAD